MNYFIRTFGCQMNEHDSEFIAGILEQKGYTKTDELESADIIVVNTCCVRENAENKLFGFVDRLKLIKKNNPNIIVAIVGCMMSENDMAKRLAKRNPYVDILLGSRNLYRLPYFMDQLNSKRKTIIEVGIDEEVPEGRIHSRIDEFRAYVTIMYGCDNFCSYCIVPYVRGREISRGMDNIIEEVRDLSNNGVTEIMLLGQNVNSYGKGLPDGEDFPTLIRELNKIDGLEIIKYMTSHPKDFSDDIINAIYESDKVTHHFHLPIQSGSNRILKMMNRGYDREYYLDLVNKIKSKFIDASITTDIIVGFPGETDDDFNDTVDIVQKVGYDSSYTFIYSPREGTPAAKITNQVPDDVKKERLQKLMSVQNEISRSINESLIGQTIDVLVEGVSRNNDKALTGRTATNKVVNFISNNMSLVGNIVKVKILNANTWSLEGSLLI